MSITKEELDKYIHDYSIGSPSISDEEYDQLLEEYIREHGESTRPFTRNKQSDAVNDVVCTLPKSYGVTTTMRENQLSYADWTYLNDIKQSTYVIVQPKFDGCSIAYDVATERFFTRGDVDNGESVDVTELFKHLIEWVKLIIITDQFQLSDVQSIKFEAILPIEIFDQVFKDKYKRPRDVVAATITSRNMEYAKYINLNPLRIYSNGKQYIPSDLRDLSIYALSQDFESIQMYINDLLDNGAKVKVEVGQEMYFSFECDGVVVSVMNHITGELCSDKIIHTDTGDWAKPSEFQKIYSTEVDPNHEIAIKILNMVEETKLVSIDWQFGKSGRITPVAIVEPVKFGNVTVTNIGLSTFERVINMGLRYGDTVRIMYNIVPYFIDSRHDGDLPIPIPNKCPKCGHPLDLRFVKQVQCTNPQCDGRRLGAIIRYCEKLKMFGVSEGIITKLWNAGYVNQISDLYTMDLMEAAEVDGLGPQMMSNVIKSIKSASTNVPVHRWLGALPCNAVSDKTWNTILKSVYGEDHNGTMQADVARMCYEDTPDEFLNKMLWYTHGIGTATIASINEGIRTNWDTIKSMIHYITFENGNGKSNGVVCLSGTRDATLTSALQRKGYEVTDSFNKKCIAVVIPNPTFTSSKISKAQENNIPVYTMREVLEENVL